MFDKLNKNLYVLHGDNPKEVAEAGADLMEHIARAKGISLDQVFIQTVFTTLDVCCQSAEPMRAAAQGMRTALDVYDVLQARSLQTPKGATIQ